MMALSSLSGPDCPKWKSSKWPARPPLPLGPPASQLRWLWWTLWCWWSIFCWFWLLESGWVWKVKGSNWNMPVIDWNRFFKKRSCAELSLRCCPPFSSPCGGPSAARWTDTSWQGGTWPGGPWVKPDVLWWRRLKWNCTFSLISTLPLMLRWAPPCSPVTSAAAILSAWRDQEPLRG